MAKCKCCNNKAFENAPICESCAFGLVNAPGLFFDQMVIEFKAIAFEIVSIIEDRELEAQIDAWEESHKDDLYEQE